MDYLKGKADKAANEVYEYEQMSNEERLAFHLGQAHLHILQARDLAYGTDTIDKVYNGRVLNRTLNKINSLLFHVARKNKRRLDKISLSVEMDRRL